MNIFDPICLLIMTSIACSCWLKWLTGRGVERWDFIQFGC